MPKFPTRQIVLNLPLTHNTAVFQGFPACAWCLVALEWGIGPVLLSIVPLRHILVTRNAQE
jgi:hypothetical protein